MLSSIPLSVGSKRRATAGVLVLNHLLHIDLGLKELVHQYEFSSVGPFPSLFTHDPSFYNVPMVLAEYEEGRGWEMLKLEFSSWDLDVSLPVFAFKLLPLGYFLAPEEVNMIDFEKDLSFFYQLWKFLKDPLIWHLGQCRMLSPLNFLHPWGLALPF